MITKCNTMITKCNTHRTPTLGLNLGLNPPQKIPGLNLGLNRRFLVWFKPRFKPGFKSKGGVKSVSASTVATAVLFAPACWPLFLARRMSRFGFDPPARPIRVGPARAPDPGLTRPAPAPGGWRPRIHIRAKNPCPRPAPGPGSLRRSYTGRQASSIRAHQHSSYDIVSTPVLCLKAQAVRTSGRQRLLSHLRSTLEQRCA